MAVVVLLLLLLLQLLQRLILKLATTSKLFRHVCTGISLS
jgi:hypothetical protein